jgi:hypothetical protein
MNPVTKPTSDAAERNRQPGRELLAGMAALLLVVTWPTWLEGRLAVVTFAGPRPASSGNARTVSTLNASRSHQSRKAREMALFSASSLAASRSAMS